MPPFLDLKNQLQLDLLGRPITATAGTERKAGAWAGRPDIPDITEN